MTSTVATGFCARTRAFTGIAVSPSGRDVVNVGVIGRPANDGKTNVWYAILSATEGGLGRRAGSARVRSRVPGRRDAREEFPEEFVETILTGWWTTCLEIPARQGAGGLEVLGFTTMTERSLASRFWEPVPPGSKPPLPQRRRGYPFRVYEASTGVAGHIRNWEHVQLFTPWDLNVSARIRHALEQAGEDVPEGTECPRAPH